MRTEKKAVSEEFKRAFDSHAGGIARTCSCGRVWWDASAPASYFEKGEREDLERREARNPNACTSIDRTVATYNVGGHEIVWDCPCGTAASLEEVLRKNAPQVACFLNALAEQYRQRAEAITAPKPESLV
jgi:hypothetical protein